MTWLHSDASVREPLSTIRFTDVTLGLQGGVRFADGSTLCRRRDEQGRRADVSL